MKTRINSCAALCAHSDKDPPFFPSSFTCVTINQWAAERKVGGDEIVVVTVVVGRRGRNWNWTISDLWLLCSYCEWLEREIWVLVNSAVYILACDYHCRIINEIRSISAHSDQPVGSTLARLKTLISSSHCAIDVICFPVHQQVEGYFWQKRK